MRSATPLMKIRPLIIDEALTTKIAQIERYAREHHYIPGETNIPGELAQHVLRTSFGYRAVFSYTQVPDGLYRDLSVSVAEKGKWPNPISVYALAECFGFTGWLGGDRMPQDWMIDKDIYHDAIRVVQPLK